MKIKEYLSEFRMRAEQLAVMTELSVAALNHYMSGRRRPSQKTAERIERETGGRVTVMESRGKDARQR